MSRPRIRSLKPEMWAHEKVGQVSIPARLLFVGLITMADDEGRLRGLLPAILGHVFPYDDIGAKRLQGWLEELERVSLIVRYTVAEKPYVELLGWASHQKVNKPSPSDLPPPPFTERSRNGHGTLRDKAGSPQ